MNYESGPVERDDLLEYSGGGDVVRRRRLVIAIVIAVLAVLIIGYFLMRHEEKAPPPAPTQAPSVTVVVPGRTAVGSVVSGTGSLAARREMPVGVAGEGGLVTRVLVEPGDWVKAGQVLATVDRSVQTQTADSLAAQVRAAQADAELAQSNYERAQQLVGRGFISKADLDQKQATRDAAQARVRVAQAQLNETRARNARLDIRSPAAGLVLTRNVEPGQIVSSGSGVLFRVAKGGEMEMLAQLSEADLARVTVGVPAEVTPVGGDLTVKGQVWQVSPVIDPQTRQGIARISIPYNKAIRPGGFATARIMTGSSDTPILPESAVQSDNGANYVYVVGSDNKVERRTVTAGEVSDAGVSIVNGLNGNERVVLSAGAFLTPGQKITPVLKKAQD